MHTPQNQNYKLMLQMMNDLEPLMMSLLKKKYQRRYQMINRNLQQSESANASVPKQLELFKEYELIEQDGYITIYPDLETLLTKKESPESMEVEKGSITFEKND